MDPATIASIAAPIIGGLFGGKQKKPEYVVPDYAKIRAKAEAAGFNPEAALMAAGGGGVVSGGVDRNWADAVASGLSAYSQADVEQQRLDLEKTNLDQRERELDQREKQAARAQSVPLAITPRPKVVGAGQSSFNVAPVSSGGIGSGPHFESASIWEPSDNQPAPSVPLTTQIRTGRKGDRPWQGLNPDGWDIDIWELLGGAVAHGGEWAANAWLDAVPDIARMNDGPKVKTRHGHRVPLPDSNSGVLKRRFPNLGSQYW